MATGEPSRHAAGAQHGGEARIGGERRGGSGISGVRGEGAHRRGHLGARFHLGRLLEEGARHVIQRDGEVNRGWLTKNSTCSIPDRWPRCAPSSPRKAIDEDSRAAHFAFRPPQRLSRGCRRPRHSRSITRRFCRLRLRRHRFVSDDGRLAAFTPRDGYPLYFAIGELFLLADRREPAHALNLASAVEAAVACGLRGAGRATSCRDRSPPRVAAALLFAARTPSGARRSSPRSTRFTSLFVALTLLLLLRWATRLHRAAGALSSPSMRSASAITCR